MDINELCLAAFLASIVIVAVLVLINQPSPH